MDCHPDMHVNNARKCLRIVTEPDGKSVRGPESRL